MKTKNIIAFGLISISLAFVNPVVEAKQMPVTIHDKIEITNLSSGVVHESIQKFTVGGWYNINVLRVDLNDQYTSLGPLYHLDGLSSRTNVKNLVEQRNAVAGINADFYNTNPIPTSLGALVENGKILSSPNNLPTFFTTADNSAYIDYFTRDMKITNFNTGNILRIDTINKLHSEFVTITMLDSNWGAKSIGNRFGKDIHEVLIIDGYVVDRRTGGEAFNIPKSNNSFVLTSKSSNLLLFNPGERVYVELDVTPNMDSIKFAIGSGSTVLKDGQVTNTDVNIAGNQPRTGLGIARDQKEVIMVTVDGRDTYFKGTTQETLGSLLKDLGAYNAVNFDGGGSTAMAIKPVGSTEAEFVNKPTEQRNVVNGVGVFSTAPQGEIDNLSLSTNSEHLFSGNSTSLNLKGFDANKNFHSIDPKSVNWSVTNGIGNVQAGTFFANSPGTGEIIASYNGVTTKLPITVLNPPVEIQNDPLHGPSQSEGLKIAVYSEPKIVGNTLMAKVVASHRLKGLTESLSTAKIGIQVGNMTSEFKNAVNHTTTLNGGSAYGKAEAQGVYVINLQANANGIRAANSNQWIDLVSDFENRSEKNLIISISRPVFGPNGFTDKMEAELFHELLTKQVAKGKNIFVVQSDGENNCTLKDGVRYITLTGATVSTPEEFSRYSYVEFTMNDENTSYEVRTPYSFN